MLEDSLDDGSVASLIPRSFLLGVAILGDPDPISLLITLVYFATAALCFVVARKSGFSLTLGIREGIRRFGGGVTGKCDGDAVRANYWFGLAMALFFLGVNKQADLQTLVDTLGKGLLNGTWLYDYRRFIQLAFVVVVTCTIVVASVFAFGFAKRLDKPAKLAAVGLAVQAVFIVLRNATFHGFKSLAALGFLNAVIEMAGLSIICIAVFPLLREDLSRVLSGFSRDR
jgi:hypothetical protein